MSERSEISRVFSRGVEEHMDTLYGVGVRFTRNAADAEDLVAEAVAKAWSAIDTLADPTRLRAWLLRILRNHFISDYRRNAARPTIVSFDEHVEEDGDGEVVSLLNEQPIEFLKWWADPEKEVSNKLLGEHIMAAIDALPEAFRMTILLVNVEGLGYDEAAAVLGVPPGTVRSRMKRGRTLLQRALWEHARDAGLAVDRGEE
jgi:RNA polymerase sigma-70 factor (ECF subfamily)